jgi:hypothetical protein
MDKNDLDPDVGPNFWDRTLAEQLTTLGQLGRHLRRRVPLAIGVASLVAGLVDVFLIVVELERQFRRPTAQPLLRDQEIVVIVALPALGIVAGVAALLLDRRIVCAWLGILLSVTIGLFFGWCALLAAGTPVDH